MSDLRTRTITALILGALVGALFIFAPSLYFSILLAILLAIILSFEWPQLLDIHKPLFWLLMPLYPILPFILLILLNQNPHYHNLLYYLLISVCSFDVGSYFAGRLFGRHKITSTISPGKTWEGSLGGYITAVALTTLWCCWMGIHLNFSFLIVFTLLVCASALCGDLFESWLKRRAALKDSGSLLPGHGGLLDRLDGILFAVVMIYYYRTYLANVFGG